MTNAGSLSCTADCAESVVADSGFAAFAALTSRLLSARGVLSRDSAADGVRDDGTAAEVEDAAPVGVGRPEAVIRLTIALPVALLLLRGDGFGNAAAEAEEGDATASVAAVRRRACRVGDREPEPGRLDRLPLRLAFALCALLALWCADAADAADTADALRSLRSLRSRSRSLSRVR